MVPDQDPDSEFQTDFLIIRISVSDTKTLQKLRCLKVVSCLSHHSCVLIIIVLQGDKQCRVSECQTHTAVFLPGYTQESECVVIVTIDND